MSNILIHPVIKSKQSIGNVINFSDFNGCKAIKQNHKNYKPDWIKNKRKTRQFKANKSLCIWYASSDGSIISNEFRNEREREKSWKEN